MEHNSQQNHVFNSPGPESLENNLGPEQSEASFII